MTICHRLEKSDDKSSVMTAHPTGDQLEAYVLARLLPEDMGVVKEHILTYPPCADKLQQMQVYVQAMRNALKRLSEDGAL